MFLRNAWYVGAMAEEITDKPLARTLLGEPIVLFRDRQGRAAALEDRCCHRAAPLSLGEVVEGGLQCGYHGLVFNGEGACVHIPGQDRIPPQARVRTYPIVEQDQLVWIWMGDPARASKKAPIPFPHRDRDTTPWRRTQFMAHAKSSYILLVENLMDLTHLAYLHKATIGGAQPQAHTANVEMKVEDTATGLRFTRWSRGRPAAPNHTKYFGLTGRVDHLQEFEYVAPCFVLQRSVTHDCAADLPAGATQRAFPSLALHAITPETERSTHYFSIMADIPSPGKPDPVAATKPVLAEDLPMVEGQQLRMERSADNLIDIRSDLARAPMARFLAAQIAAEQKELTAAR